MIGKTLSLYIAQRFLWILLGMVLGLTFLIVTVDFIEQLRKTSGVENVKISSLYLISVLRAPAFVEKAFPFACLFAAMMTLTQLNLKMELVVARSAGVSAWQFLLPISCSAILVGIFLALVYNPFSIAAVEYSKDLIAVVMQKERVTQSASTRNYWIKQKDGSGGSTVINAGLAREGGTILDNVMIIQLDEKGQIYNRIDSKQANFSDGSWILENNTSTDASGLKTNTDIINLETGLTKDDLLGISAMPEHISFWKLRNVAKRVEKSGTNGKPYLVQYHTLTALPFFLLAMVLVAATVCLRFVRFGQVGRMILGGILSGFVLYIVSSLITALGSNGIVPPIVAAWAPSFVAILFGMGALLHQEDG